MNKNLVCLILGVFLLIILGKLIKSGTPLLFLLLASFSISSIEFHGKIIDQYGQPVSNVTINYTGSSHTFASGSGPGITESNIDGKFFINNARGTSLKIYKLSKLGYELPLKPLIFKNSREGVDATLTWANYTHSQPYIIDAWKVEEYPRIKKNTRLFMKFEPDGRKYTLSIIGNGERFNEGKYSGDFIFSFLKQKAGWQLDIIALNEGGVIETDDLFKYMAPKSGYRQSISFKSKDLKGRVSKDLYFYNEEKQLYGYLNLLIRPSFKSEHSAVVLKYVINLENGRNLTVIWDRHSLKEVVY